MRVIYYCISQSLMLGEYIAGVKSMAVREVFL